MSEMYVIAWHNDSTGEFGEGIRPHSRAEAEQICHEANRAMPHFRHWPKPMTDTSDLDTQPITPIDENGEDTIITRRELDEGR